MFDLKSMTWEQLDALQKQVEYEKESRTQRRFEELCQTACDALNALKLEYPWVDLPVIIENDDVGEIEVNIFDVYDKFTPSKFTF